MQHEMKTETGLGLGLYGFHVTHDLQKTISEQVLNSQLIGTSTLIPMMLVDCKEIYSNDILSIISHFKGQELLIPLYR